MDLTTCAGGTKAGSKSGVDTRRELARCFAEASATGREIAAFSAEVDTKTQALQAERHLESACKRAGKLEKLLQPFRNGRTSKVCIETPSAT